MNFFLMEALCAEYSWKITKCVRSSLSIHLISPLTKPESKPHTSGFLNWLYDVQDVTIKQKKRWYVSSLISRYLWPLFQLTFSCKTENIYNDWEKKTKQTKNMKLYIGNWKLYNLNMSYVKSWAVGEIQEDLGKWEFNNLATRGLILSRDSGRFKGETPVILDIITGDLSSSTRKGGGGGGERERGGEERGEREKERGGREGRETEMGRERKRERRGGGRKRGERGGGGLPTQGVTCDVVPLLVKLTFNSGLGWEWREKGRGEDSQVVTISRPELIVKSCPRIHLIFSIVLKVK